MSKEKQCKCCKEYWWEMNIHSQTGLCPNCYDYVADLEAKLAESEKEKERIKKNWRISRTQQQKLYENLKQKNKEAGVVNYPIVLDGCRISNEEQLLDFAKDFVLEKAYWQEQLADKNQDKISFCVEQLEKMKETLIEDLFDLYRSPCLIYETYGDEYDSAIQDAINNTIDNQIKQLTHQHEGKGE